MKKTIAVIAALLLGVVVLVGAAFKGKDKADYGRMLFVGDSRTVDMFTSETDDIRGEVHDGITVYAHDCYAYDQMIEYINEYGVDNFDTLVTAMGCNSYGDFSQYKTCYNDLLSKGKKIIVCTVGPTADECLANDFDRENYTNDLQIKFNKSLKAWAKKKGVKVIDLYSFIDNSTTIVISPADGIHYYPQPTPELWRYILENLK